MTRKAHKTYTLAEVLAEYPDEICDLAMELREFVQGVIPQARETVRWQGISYTRPEEKGFVKGDICGIALFEEFVQLRFVHGAFLPDPDGLLEDDGRKHMRHIKLYSSRDMRPAAFEKLILASLKCKPWET